jgi:antitoxin PrlF
MTTATLTSKGQTTIPKEIRDSLGLRPGDQMTFTLLSNGTVVMRAKTKSVLSLGGSLRGSLSGRKRVPTKQLSR